MSNFFEICVLIFLAGLMGSGVYFSIERRMYHILFLFGSLFLVCLIHTLSLIQTILIDDITLLQINATLIAGALILLTITSFVSKTSHKPIIVLRRIAITPYQVGGGAIVAFSASAIVLFWHDLHLAKIIDVIGFIWLVFSGFIITAKEQFSQGEDNE